MERALDRRPASPRLLVIVAGSIAALALVAGCDGSTGGGGGGDGFTSPDASSTVDADATNPSPANATRAEFEAAALYFAETYCGLKRTCGCPGATDAAVAVCIQQSANQYEIDALLEGGLTLDAEHVRARADLLAEYGCAGVSALGEASARLCDLPGRVGFHGDVGVGGACNNSGLGQASQVCARDLTCVSSVCVDPCQAEGAACGLGGPGCGTGLYCESTSSSCVPAARVGEVCEGAGVFRRCERGAYCDDEGVCVSKHGEGEACSRLRCEAGLLCDDDSGVCVAESPGICAI